jgi:hypothetical protein
MRAARITTERNLMSERPAVTADRIPITQLLVVAFAEALVPFGKAAVHAAALACSAPSGG